MKKIFLSFSVLAMIVTFAACKKSSPGPSTNASVMFVNGCAGAANVDVSVNNTKLVAASNLAFLKSSGYQTVTAASGILFGFALTATGTPLDSATESITATSNYSAFASGIVTSTSLVFAADDLSAPASGMAKVRFVNLSSDNLNLSCYIGSQKIDSNVAMATVTPFFSITAATSATVLLQDPSKPTELSQLTAQSFAAGKIYTIMLTGTSTGTLTSVLTLTILPNN